jgi:HEAT repeat protein
MINRIIVAAPQVASVPPPASAAAAPVAEAGLLALAIAIAILALCAIGFAVIAGVLRYRNRRKEREWLAREAKWEKPLLDTLIGDSPAEALWSLVAEQEGLYFVDYLLRFARRIKGSTRDRLADLAQPYLEPVVARIGGGDPERRGRAVETIATLSFDRHHELVVAALDDPSPLVAMIAARSIARQQRPEHTRLLLGHMSRVAEWSPRQLTAMLVSMGAESMPALRLAFEDEETPPSLRAIAADALRRLHDPEAMETALRVLPGASDRDLIAATLRLMADLGHTGQAHDVRPLCTHPDPVIRAVALQALTTTGGAEDQELLRGGMEDESGWVAIQSALGMMRTGDGASLRARAQRDDPLASLAQQVLVESR